MPARSESAHPGAATPVEGPTVAIAAPTSGSAVFGDFLLLEPLGKGGMATVFRARRRGSEDVALKRPLSAFLSESEFVERFIREAEIGRTLNHPLPQKVQPNGSRQSLRLRPGLPKKAKK